MLASDGVWDVFSNQEVVRIAGRALRVGVRSCSPRAFPLPSMLAHKHDRTHVYSCIARRL